MSVTVSTLAHVTTILADLGLVNTEWFTDHARERGTALHLACQLLDEGDLDESTLDPEIVEPLVRYRQFLWEVQPEILSIEESVDSPLGYCGRLDRRVKIHGREGVLDLKGQPSPANPLQLAGYALCFPRPLARWNLYLRLDSGYKLVEHTDRRTDDAAWKACVTLHSWRQAHGIN